MGEILGLGMTFRETRTTPMGLRPLGFDTVAIWR